MIWEIFIGCLIDVSAHKVKINFNKLIKLDDLIIEKLIISLLKFLIRNKNNIKRSEKFVLDHPKWKLSLQTHKILGIP